MRNGTLSRLPTSIGTLRERIVRSLVPVALALAASVPVAACGPDADPYCAEGDMSEWIGTFTAEAFWIEDGWSVKEIQVNFRTDNAFYIYLPDDSFNPENGKVVYSLPLDPKKLTGRKVILLPNAGVTTMKLRSYVLCQGIRGDYEFVFTWSGTPKVGDPVDFKLQVAK